MLKSIKCLKNLWFIILLNKIVAQIEYDGSQTSGWAQQKGLVTVEGLLLKALMELTGEEGTSIACSGRTDKGVHATTQVISFQSAITRDKDRWLTGLNHFLPPHIRVHAVRTDLDDRFHARYSARSRCYRYYLYLGERSPLFGDLVTQYRHAPPELSFLQQLSAQLLGQHDFKAFQGGSCHAKSSVRIVHEAFWERQGPLLIFQIRAQSFLHHMVRFIVGSLLETASGRQSQQWWSDLIAGKAEQHCCMPPQGLYLCHVAYDELADWVKLRKPWFDLGH